MTLALSISLERTPTTLLPGKALSLPLGRWLPALAAGGYLLGATLMKWMEKGRKRTVSVLMRCEERRCFLRALVDTGNSLQDSATGAPVLIVDSALAERLFPAGLCPTQAALRHPERAFAALSEQWDVSRLRLLPYRAVGVDSGLLLAVRVDSIEVNGAPYEGQLVAIMPGRLEEEIHGLIGEV